MFQPPATIIRSPIGHLPPAGQRFSLLVRTCVAGTQEIHLVHLAAFLVLWLQASPPPSNQNVVRVCSVAEGAADPCQDFDARLLEPSRSATASGLRAFVDPETGMLTEPTQEQIEALSAEVAIHVRVRREEQPGSSRHNPAGRHPPDPAGQELRHVPEGCRRAREGRKKP